MTRHLSSIYSAAPNVLAWNFVHKRVRKSVEAFHLFNSCNSIFLFLDKALKKTLDRVLLSGYFDRFPSHQNGCEEEEDEEAASAAAVALTESSEAEEQAVDPGPDRSLRLRCMNLCSGNTFAIEQWSKSYIHKCFSTETEIITEFSEPITVEITEVCFTFLAAVKFLCILMCGDF